MAKSKATWVRYKPKEIEKLVIKEAKHGLKPSMIGMVLRDSYGIPDVESIAGKKITQILDDNSLKMQLPEELFFLIKKSLAAREHLDKNKKDVSTKRSLSKTEARIRKLSIYYIKEKKLPADWKYDPSKAKILLE
jgi:small subunit ribosomal protein S15